MASSARATERLLAEDVLARLRRRDARFGVNVVGAAVVEDLHVGVGDQVAPVGIVFLVAVAFGGFGGRFGVAPGDRDQSRDGDRRIHHVGQLLECVGVRLAHEGIAEHPDANRRRFSFGFAPRH